MPGVFGLQRRTARAASLASDLFSFSGQPVQSLSLVVFSGRDVA